MLVELSISWYKDVHQRIGPLLQTEIELSQMVNLLNEQDDTIAFKDIFVNLDYQFNAKLHLFCVAEYLARLILSCFCYGPAEATSRYGFNLRQLNISWLDYGTNTEPLFEILSAVLEKENCGQGIAIAVLLQDRYIRNNLAHKGGISICMSAIRSYNVLREMLLFLKPEEDDKLPQFSYSPMFSFDFDAFVEHSGDLKYNFNNLASILFVDSLHDIKHEQKELLANLPWDVVIDLDGYSKFGGLYGAVSHPNKQSSLLTKKVIKDTYTPTKGITWWFRSGDFMNYEFVEVDKDDKPILVPLVPDKKHFLHSKRYFEDDMEDIFIALIEKIMVLDRPISLIYLAQYSEPAKAFLRALRKMRDAISYTFTGACYMTTQTIDDIKKTFSRDDKADVKFKILQATPQNFLDELFAHQRTLGLSIRSSSLNYLTLPGKGGSVEIKQNDFMNLNVYFEILHSGCEKTENAREQIDEFYEGGTVPWCAFEEDMVVNIVKDKDIETMVHRFKSLLGVTQDDGEKRIYLLRHLAGIGGTTLLRQIGWRMHKDYAVLFVRKYDIKKTKELLSNLYDHVLDKAPFIVLADDSLVGLEHLYKDIKALRRRCLLIVAARQNSEFANNFARDLALHKSISIIKEDEIKLLRKRFYQHSNLADEDKKKKDAKFESFIQECGSSPFIIGLYYMEKDFTIHSYVERAFRDIREASVEKAMVMLALCGVYAKDGLPVSLVKSMVNMSDRKDFLHENRSASVLVIQKNSSDIPKLQEKHYLLSEKVLEIYNEKHHNPSDQRDMLYTLSKDLINSVYQICNYGIKKEYLDILIELFIKYKTWSPDKPVPDYSDLIEAIEQVDSQREIMELLATQFSKVADGQGHNDIERNSPKEALFRLVAHAYAHLGRLYYKRRDGGSQNYKRASEALEKAIEYNDVAKLNDPKIYHMVGDCRSREICIEWEDRQKIPDVKLDIEKYIDYEARIAYIAEYFNKSVQYGGSIQEPSQNYALPDKIRLYLKYLQFVYVMRNINNSEEKRLLNDGQRKVLALLEESFEERDCYELNDDAVRKIQEYEDTYRSGVLFRAYGEAVTYYENRLKELRESNATPHELDSTSRGLVLAKIRKYKNLAILNNEDKYNVFINLSENEAKDLFRELDELVDRSLTQIGYSERMRKTVLYNYWIQLAKVLDKPIEDGLRVAKRWIELTEMERYTRDPRPYYYLYTLHYLDALDGTIDGVKNAKRAQGTIQDMIRENRFTSGYYKRDRIQDILISDKKGMGQLFYYYGLDTNDRQSVLEVFYRYKLKLRTLSGEQKDVEHNIAFLSLYDPKEWFDCIAETRIGHSVPNSLSEFSNSHKISFYGGFGYERIQAIPSLVWDPDANESPPEFDPKSWKGNRTIDAPHVKEEKNAWRPSQKYAVNKPKVYFIAIRSENGTLQGWIQDRNKRTWKCSLPRDQVEEQDIRILREKRKVTIKCQVESIQDDRYILKRQK